MRPTSIALTLCAIVALGLAAGLAPAAARGLTGRYRASFMALVTQHCAELGAADADLSKLPPAAFRDFCRCTAARVADRTTPAEVEADETPHLVALERAATQVCYRALRADVAQ